MLIFSADLPPSAACFHHQHWPTPPSRRICPWERSLQRAADIHMVRPQTFCAAWCPKKKRGTNVCLLQDGCDSEGADQPGEGSVSRSQKKGDPLQLCHRLPWPQRESVQVSITLHQHWLAGLLLNSVGKLCALYIKTSPPTFTGWKISATLYPAGRARMTPWRCSLSASRSETIWTSPSRHPTELRPWAHAWGPSEHKCRHVNRHTATVLGFFGFFFLFNYISLDVCLIL